MVHKVSIKISAVNLKGLHLTMTWPCSLTRLRVSFCYTFQSLSVICHGEVLFSSGLGALCTSCYWMSFSFSTLERFSITVSLNRVMVSQKFKNIVFGFYFFFFNLIVQKPIFRIVYPFFCLS